MTNYCEKCGETLQELFESAYGYTLCDDCWDDYICSDKGKVEYLIGIVRGDYPMDYYDADFLGEVAVAWKEYKYLLALSVDDIFDIEDKAKEIGLL
jgi:hypothetical protein